MPSGSISMRRPRAERTSAVKGDHRRATLSARSRNAIAASRISGRAALSVCRGVDEFDQLSVDRDPCQLDSDTDIAFTPQALAHVVHGYAFAGLGQLDGALDHRRGFGHGPA